MGSVFLSTKKIVKKMISNLQQLHLQYKVWSVQTEKEKYEYRNEWVIDKSEIY